MPLALPSGCRTAVCITVDFDAQSVWMASLGLTTPLALSRGEFGAEVGVRRLLHAFAEHEVPTTWFVPGHTLETFPAQAEAVVAAGHEIAAHGCYHEMLSSLPAGREEELLVRQLEQHAAAIGRRPEGYRAPAWELGEETLALLERHGFAWDSSLMGRDLEPYHPRPVELRWEQGNRFGAPSGLLEIPVSWYTIDWEAFEYVPAVSPGLGDTEVVERRWLETLRFAREEEPGGVLTYTLHPQTSGRPHHLAMLRRFLAAVRGYEDVLLATVSDVYRRWGESATG